MTVVLVVLGVTLFPVAGLGLLLWLTHLEETLPEAVEVARRAPEPPPILAVEVRAVENQAFSRSATISLGGSTNR